MIRNNPELRRSKKRLRSQHAPFRHVLFIINLFMLAFWAWSSMTILSAKPMESKVLEDDISVGIDQIAGIAQPVYGRHVVWKSPQGDDIEAVYALPKTARKQKMKGIALLLHACTHNAFKFFSPSDDLCPSCLGLAEELRIVRILLSRNYATLAVTSKDQNTGCWSDNDLPRLDIALKAFQREILSDKDNDDVKTIIAVGASSGGNMAAKVAVERKADAALVMVMALRPTLQKRFSSSIDAPPPIYLAPMPKDVGTTKRAEQNYEAMMSESFGSHAYVKLDKTNCVPLAVTTSYLMGRVPGMTIESAERIVKGLKEAKHLSEDSSLLLVDPTRSNWRDILTQMDNAANETPSVEDFLWGKFLLTPGKSPLAKALHRAWAFHEYCSESVEPALNFFERLLASEMQ